MFEEIFEDFGFENAAGACALTGAALIVGSARSLLDRMPCVTHQNDK